MARFINVKSFPKVKVRDQRAGRTDRKSNSVIIPLWTFAQGIEYVWSYIIHEICHYAARGEGHSRVFKNKERKVLAEFDLYPVYAKAYAKELKNSAGQTVWKMKMITNRKNMHDKVNINGIVYQKGDLIKVDSYRYGVITAEFVGYRPRNHKYPMIVNIKGQIYKYSTRDIVNKVTS